MTLTFEVTKLDNLFTVGIVFSSPTFFPYFALLLCLFPFQLIVLSAAEGKEESTAESDGKMHEEKEGRYEMESIPGRTIPNFP